MFLESSKVFGKPDMVMEGTLKKPTQYRDAVLYEALSNLSSREVGNFVNSKEAKAMLAEGMISPDVLDRILAAKNGSDVMIKSTVCHLAKENQDPLWDELVAARIEERRILNDLIAKYGEQALVVAESVGKKITDTIPRYFRV